MSAPGAQALADGKLLLDRPLAGVARLTICNPAKRNALDHPILDAMSEALDALGSAAEGPVRDAEDDPDGTAAVRCLLITGCNGMFSAGYDIGEIPEQQFQEQAERLVAHPFTAAIDALERFPFPTIAVLSGHTIGGGLELALACDLRIARADIRLGMPPAKLGLVYSHTGLRRFIDTIGAARTRELFLLGRNIDAERALAWGLINATAGSEQLEDRAFELAGEIAANAPLSLRGNKRIIGELLGARSSLPGDLEAELIQLREASFASEDMREGVRAFAEKRPPRFRGR